MILYLRVLVERGLGTPNQYIFIWFKELKKVFSACSLCTFEVRHTTKRANWLKAN